MPALLIGLAEATGMILVGVFVFRVPFHGSVGLLYLSMMVYLAAVIGVGLFISSLAKTQQQAILGAFVFMVPAMLLSGFATPIENMPDWLQTADAGEPDAPFHGDREGSVPEGHAGRRGRPPPRSADRHRVGHSLRRELALPPAAGVAQPRPG